MGLIRIELPESKEKDTVRVPIGTKVFCGDVEIEGVTDITINISPDEILSATISLAIKDVTNMNDLQPMIGDCNINSLNTLVKKYGKKIVDIE
jgi:hypothetical protein